MYEIVPPDKIYAYKYLSRLLFSFIEKSKEGYIFIS